jgi:hypothetical protein
MLIGGVYVATSTFFKNIYIDEKAADVLIKGLEGAKPPKPVSRKEERERGEQLLKQFRLNLTISETKTSE